MKTILTSLAIILTSAAFSQNKVVFEDDTAMYKGQKFYAGKEFMMGTGSAPDKSFAYVYVSNLSYTDTKPLYPVFAKEKFVVEKVYNTNRGWSVQTRLPDLTKNNGKIIKGEIVFFLIDKAVDSKEVAVE